MEKEIEELKRYDKVEVFWIDSSHESKWTDDKDYLEDKEETLDCRTCGYFLNKLTKCINIVQSHQEYINKEGIRSVDSLMQIPIVSINKIIKLLTKEN